MSYWSSDVCSSDLRGRHRAVAVGRGDAGGKEIFELEQPARAGEIFVAGDAADCRFVHANGLGDLAQRQRAHLRDAVKEKAFLLLDEIGRASCRERVCQYV